MFRQEQRRKLPAGLEDCDTAPQMELTLVPTAVICAALLALAVFAGWRGAQPPNPHKGPRLAPWRFIMVTTVAVLLMMVVHLVNLLGFTTGNVR